MTRLLTATCLLLLLALTACKPALHGVAAGADADAQLCKRLVDAYRTSDWESLPMLAPLAKDLNAVLKESSAGKPGSGVEPAGAPSQKELERSMIAMAQAYLDSSGVAPKDLQFGKVEQASTISTGGGPFVLRQDWLIMRGPSGGYRQQVFVMEFGGRAYLASWGAIIRSEE